jgi:hypothetical protein
MRDENEETKKRRTASPSMGGTSSNLSKVMMMTLVNGLAVSCSAAASESSRAMDWAGLPSGCRILLLSVAKNEGKGSGPRSW